ncbi:MAG: serine protease [Candidatus Omnitrophota bacterium]
MNWKILYKSLFAILRVENNNAKVVGTGFVINTNPIYILTCNHVVGESTEDNDGVIKYSITKRTDKLDEFDLRSAQISFIRAKKVCRKPEYDLAILEVDPSTNKDVAAQLNLESVKSLQLDLGKQARGIGAHVEWMSTGTLGDLTLTPRFFRGNLVASYTTNHNYEFIGPQQAKQTQMMSGVKFLEIDQLFIPGSSGSPLLNSQSGRVIGYVHGFKSWPIMTNATINYPAEIQENSTNKNVKIKSQTPLVTSLSLAIDLQFIYSYLIENRFVSENFISKLKRILV